MSTRTGETLPGEAGGIREYLPPIVTHMLLIVGVLFFEWDVIEILLLYLIEIAVIHVVFVTAALCAARPIADHDADKWQTEPNPIRVISGLPPVYRRNVALVRKYLFFGVIYILPVFYAVTQFADQSFRSLFSPVISLALLAICLSQFIDVWRQFFADQSYHEWTPAEAIKIGLRPIHELFVLLLFVVVPVTFILVAVSFALGDVESRTVVLLAYVLPIGAARVWLQDNNLTVTLQYEK